MAIDLLEQVPDVAAIRNQVDAVLAEPLCWFPVRHHSRPLPGRWRRSS